MYSVRMSTFVLESESERSRHDAFPIFTLSSLSVHASAKVAEMLKQLEHLASTRHSTNWLSCAYLTYAMGLDFAGWKLPEIEVG